MKSMTNATLNIHSTSTNIVETSSLDLDVKKEYHSLILRFHYPFAKRKKNSIGE